ncbi:MAG: hypothetical protein Q9179_004902, partial [Wetmoreana sp. 5 TL-2023]
MSNEKCDEGPKSAEKPIPLVDQRNERILMTPKGPHLNPLRAHPDVMAFHETPPATEFNGPGTKPELAGNIRPIRTLPNNLPEELFARVTYYGDEYWITDDRQDDGGSVGEDYVVVEKEDAEDGEANPEQNLPE